MNVSQIDPAAPGVLVLLAQSDRYMAALYPAESNHMTDAAALRDPAVTFLAVSEGDTVVACGALVRQDAGMAEIKRMFVSEDHRGRGFGKRILEHLMEIADAERLTLRLETGARQPEAIGLYRAHGFAEIPAFAPYGPDPLSVFMERPGKTRP